MGLCMVTPVVHPGHGAVPGISARHRARSQLLDEALTFGACGEPAFGHSVSADPSQLSPVVYECPAVSERACLRGLRREDALARRNAALLPAFCHRVGSGGSDDLR